MDELKTVPGSGLTVRRFMRAIAAFDSMYPDYAGISDEALDLHVCKSVIDALTGVDRQRDSSA